MRRIVTCLLLCAVVFTLSGCGKSAEVKETERLIDAIGEVTLESAEAVEAAEESYAALAPEARETVSNGETLAEARQVLDAARLEKLRRDIVGTWRVEQDRRDLLTNAIDEELGSSSLNFRDYLDAYPVVMEITFRDDGTYQIQGDRTVIEEAERKAHDALVRFLRMTTCSL